VFAFYGVFVILLNLVLLSTGFEYDFSSEAYDWKTMYGIISGILYAIMVFFSIQPLKYITKKRQWYTYFAITSIVFLVYNFLLASIVNNALILRTNIIEKFKLYDNPIILLIFIALITFMIILFSIKYSLKLAKR